MARLSALLIYGTLMIGAASSEGYYGKSLGKLSEFHHGVSGHVYAVDGRTLFIKDFTYDGEGPAAYFYVGNTKSPSNSGAWRLRDERSSSGVLSRYRKKDITLSLPEGKTFQNIKWFSVWCDEFSVNFGDVKIPRNFEYPKPLKIGSLSGVHGVSSDAIVIVDAQTLLIPNFSYDGEAPDAKFWVGVGDKPTSQGYRIPDENGKEVPLRRYDRKTIVLTLPSDLTVFDIGHFGVWCEAFTVDFGHVKITGVNNVPPSLKMLGVSPQSKLNCEVLFDDLAFEVRWAVAGESIVVQLVAKLEDGEYMSFGLSGSADHSQMVGGDVTVAWVDKGTLKGYAYDYFLDAKSQCAGTRGSCPDENLGEKTNSVRLLNAAMVNGYSIVTYQRPLRAADELDRPILTNASQPIIWAIGPLNSKNEVSYHSQFTKADRFLEFGRAPVWNCPMPEMDDGERQHRDNAATKNPGDVNNGQFLTETTHLKDDRDDYLGAYEDSTSSGSLDNTQQYYTTKSVPTPKPAPTNDAWEIPPINCDEPEDGVFYAQMGPTGGKHGYPAITGHVGWGISWYINGLLIPEINVVRGKTYTFVVEGGYEINTPARYHPFYITDDPVGGYEHRSPAEKQNISIFAGIRRTRTGEVIPIGVGRLCNWTPDLNGPSADEYPSFGAYQRSLTLACDDGEPGVITWIPDEDTPDTVYYQCFTHRYLGWKINVLDQCDISPQALASENQETYLRSDLNIGEEEEDLESRASVRVSTRVRPDSNFVQDNSIKGINDEKYPYRKNIENHNLNGYDGEMKQKEKKDDILTGEVEYESFPDLKRLAADHALPISPTQLKEVIDTVESYETKATVDEGDRPVYQHSTSAPESDFQNSENGIPERPLHEDEELIIELQNTPSKFVLPPNQKPMTLQTFLRPFPGKPGPQFFRRPVPPEIKVRRPPAPHRMPPTRNPGQFLLGQPTFITPNKKPYYKGPVNVPPPPPLFGRPPPPPRSAQNGPNPQRPIIMGKPNLMSQTLTLGQPTIIGQHSIKTETVNFDGHINKPGQIIMGKPMENPLPLDQQMSPTRHNFPATTPKSIISLTPKVDIVTPSRYIEYTPSDMSPSELLSATSDPNENLITMRPAINTGFKPDSVVIEGGFKPIIREPLLADEDKIATYDTNINSNRRSDVADLYERESEPVQKPATLLTETFEPMFIPSPPDRSDSEKNKATNESSPKEERPSPVYVKPEVTEETIMFEDVNMDNLEGKNVEDLAVAADRVDAYYLPPDPKQKSQKQKLSESQELPSGTVVTFDGHTVSDATLTSSSQKSTGTKMYSAKLPGNLEYLAKIPQLGPFKGEVPPISPNQNPTSKSQIVNSHSYPLKADPVYTEASTQSTFSFLYDWEKEFEKKLFEVLEPEETENEDVTALPDDAEKNRTKRAAHHTPDHTDGPGYYDGPSMTAQQNSTHDHHHHNHTHEHNDGSTFPMSWELFLLLPLGTIINYLTL